MTKIVSLQDAKTNLSALVETAAAGEQVAIAESGAERAPSGALALTHLAEDFDAPDLALEALFEGD